MNILFKVHPNVIVGHFHIGSLNIIELGTSKKEVEVKIKKAIDFYRNKGYGF